MAAQYTAVVEQAEGWFVAHSPDVPDANGQGRTLDEALKSLRDAIALILQDRSDEPPNRRA